MTSLQEKCWIKKLNPERHLPILQKPGRLWRAPLSFLGKIHKNCSLVQWASLLCWKQAQGFTTGKIVSQWWPDTRLALWACPLGAAECAPCPNSENSHTHNLLGSGLLFFFFFFFCCKKLYCFPLVQGLGEGSRVVKKLSSGCRERLQAEALTPEELLKDRWAPEPPSGAWGWAFGRDTGLAQPGDQPAYGG